MLAERVKSLIEQTLGEGEARVAGEGCNLTATVISPRFAGLSPIQRHRLVMDAVRALIQSGELHALSLTTHTPEDWHQRAG